MIDGSWGFVLIFVFTIALHGIVLQITEEEIENYNVQIFEINL